MNKKDKNILAVINDEQDFWIFQQKIRDSKLGYNLSRITNGEKAIEVVAKNPGIFDFIILEQELPGITGAEFIKKINMLGFKIPGFLIADSSQFEISKIKNELQNVTIFPKNQGLQIWKNILDKIQNGHKTKSLNTQNRDIFPFIEDTLKYIKIIDQNAIIKYAYGFLEEDESSELIGSNIFDLISYNYQKELLEIIKEVLLKGIPRSLSIKEENDENKVEQLFYLFPLNKSDDQKLLVAVVIDISDVLPENIENVTDTAIIINKKGEVLAYNEKAKYMADIDDDKIIGQNISDVISTSSKFFTVAGIEKVINTSQPLNFVDKQNGNIFDCYIYPIFNIDKNVEYMAIFTNDITQGKSKDLNHKINKSGKKKNSSIMTLNNIELGNSKFYQIIDQAKDAGILTDLQGKIIYWGKSAEQLYGYSSDEMLGKSFKHYFLTDDDKAVSASKKEEIIQTGIFLQVGENKKNFIGEIGKKIIYTDAGLPEYYFVTIEDVTKKVRIEREFKKFNIRLKQLVENRTIKQKKIISKFQNEVNLYKKMEQAQRKRGLIQSIVSFAAQKIQTTDSFSTAINQILEKAGFILNPSRIYVIENSYNQNREITLNLKYEWTNIDSEPIMKKPLSQGVSYKSAGLERWIKVMENGRTVFQNIIDLPKSEQKWLKKRDISSIIAIPINCNKNWVGYLGIDESSITRKWYKAEINALRMLSVIIGNAYFQKLKEDELQENVEFYKTITENSGDWEYWMLPSGDLKYVSSQCEEISGYSPNDFYTDNNLFENIITDKDRKKVIDIIKNISNPQHTFDFKLRHKNGKIVWISHTGRPVYRDRQFLGVRGSIRNIQERVNKESALSRQTNALEILHEIAIELASKQNLQELLKSVLDRSVSLLSASRGSLFLYREETDDLLLVYQCNPITELHNIIVKRGEGIAGKVLEEKQPITIDNYSVWGGEKSKRKKISLGAVVGIPILWRDKIVGVLLVSDYENNSFSSEEIALLESFAPLAAAAIEQTNLIEETQKREKNAGNLRQAENIIVETISIDEMCKRILEQLTNIIPYTCASIQMLNKNKLQTIYSQGYQEKEDRVGMELHIPGNNINTKVIKEKSPIILSDLEKKPSVYFVEKLKRIKSWIGLPLIFKGEVFGMLSIASTTPGLYKNSHLVLAQSFTTQVSVAIKNAKLYEQTKNDAETKALLLEEINHRVKNNLTAIIGLLYAELSYIKKQKNISIEDVMQNIIGRVQGLALVHNMLSTSEWSPILLTQLSQKIAESVVKISSLDKNIKIQIEPSEIRISSKLANNFAIIVNELLINSLKYAFKKMSDGIITINVEQKDNKCTFIYSDNGPGYSNEILSLQKKGVGLYLIERIVQKDLQGILKLSNKNGAQVEISFSLNNSE